MNDKASRLWESGRSWRRAALLLILAAALIVVVDWMASFANGEAATSAGVWQGDLLGQSPWARAADSDGGADLDARNLLITINGDQLTARYSVDVPSSGDFAVMATTDESPNSGNDLVASVLGSVQVGEYRYGLTGDDYYYTPLSFGEPQLAVSGSTATITVESEPVRLYLPVQRVQISRPQDGSVNGDDAVDVQAPGVQVGGMSGIAIKAIGGSRATLTADADSSAYMEVWEDTAGQGWLNGVRALGGTTIPVAGYALNVFNRVFVYLVLLWALTKIAADDAASGDAVRAARKAVLTIVGGLSAAAFLWTALRLGQMLIGAGGSSAGAVAGPLGVLVAASLVWWPAASLAVWRPGRPGYPRRPGAGRVFLVPLGRGRSRGSRRVLVTRPLTALSCLVVVAVCAVLLVPFLLTLRLQGVFASRQATAAVLAAAVVALAVLMARIMFGGGALPWLVSLPMAVLTLAAVVGWPLLWFASLGVRGPQHVNVWGKWSYLAIVAAVAIGLSVMFARVFWLAAERYGKRWQRCAAVAAAAGTALAVLPGAVTASGVTAPRSTGSLPYDVFDFLLSLPGLLSWLLIAMAFLLAIALQRDPGARPAARLLAIPIAMELLSAGSSWLYLPAERLIVLPLVVWLLLPRRRASRGAVPAGGPPDPASRAIGWWRAADFTAGQRQALASASTDSLRDLLLKSDRRFDRGLASFSRAQATLAGKTARYQREARQARREAFSRDGHPLDGRDARAGLVVGAILGLAPLTVTLLAAQPPVGDGAYPVLFFLGGTAWRIGVWALLGCFVGYFQPLIRGQDGARKGALVFAVALAPAIAVAAVWDDSGGWASLLIWALEFFAFLLVASVILVDLRVLTAAGLPPGDWTRAHNWGFVVTWSTAVIAAIGTAAATFLSVAATDLSQQTVSVVTGQVNAPTANQNAQSTGSAG